MTDPHHDWDEEPPKGNASATADDAKVIVRRGSDLDPKNIVWLWPFWLARGKYHVLAGPKGAAKTTLLLMFAAIITSGGLWPDGNRAEPGVVLFWSGEDDIEDTLLPRFIAMGGNRDKIHFISAVIEGFKSRSFNPSTDLMKLSSTMDELTPSMVVIDPVSRALATTDSYNDAGVRNDLQPILDLAERHHCAFVGNTHFNKGSQGRQPIERVIGSIAMGAVPRMVLAAIRPDDPKLAHRLTRAGSNISPVGGGFEYEVVQTFIPPSDPDGEKIRAQMIVWGAPLEGSPRDILAVEEPDAEGEALKTAKDFIVDMLSPGRMLVKQFNEAADANNHSRSTIKRARKALDVSAKRDGTTGPWFVELPQHPRRDRD